ncbi:hypothetical protein F5146DRAFT_1227836 [Armillaria mellea]|nr:hypothetical protein F5146DRAFT_1227836 [Armillaria mellea]
MEAPDLSQDDKSFMFSDLDMHLNRIILTSSLHGLYSGIVVVTLWTIFTSTKRLQGTFLRTTIIMLYVFMTAMFVTEWIFEHHAFIEYGNNYYSVYAALVDDGLWFRVNYFTAGITGGICTVLVNITIVYGVSGCSEIANGKWFSYQSCVSWLQLVMQMFSGSHVISTHKNTSVPFTAEIDWSLIYVVLILNTTLLSTILIVYRIVCFEGSLLLFRRIISALIVSVMLYTLTMIMYLALVGRNITAAYYADIVAAYAKDIVPTLLALHVVTGSTAISSQWGRILAPQTPVMSASRYLMEHAQLKGYEFKSFL